MAEEAGEVMLASKNDDREEIIREMADLWFHSIVVLAYHDIPPQAILDELADRHSNAWKAESLCTERKEGLDTEARVSAGPHDGRKAQMLSEPTDCNSLDLP